MRKSFIILAAVIVLSACTPADSNDNAHHSNMDDDNEGEELADEEKGKDKEDPPESKTFVSKLPESYVTTSNIEVSDVEKEVINTLSEFDAVEVDDNTMLTLPGNILFDFDSAELRPEADDVIDQLEQVIDVSDGDVKIVGHTDSKGDDNYNQTLSEERAEAVFNALVDAGVEEKRLTAEGKGSSEPVAQNTNSDGSDNPEGRQENRRVEVTVEDFEGFD